jgi:hypothetical protein
MKLFVQLTKVDAETRRVWGRATQEVPDRSREIFDYESSKPLFEKWSSAIAEATKAAGQEISLGNVRAMHGKVAAGKLVEIDFNDAEKAIDICSEIVDDQEWAKVLKGVYTGYSIGGSYVRKWDDATLPTHKRFTANPSEISLVDLACVPTATFSCIKAAGVTEDVPFAHYGVLAASLAKSDMTVGELLSLVQEYLPDDEISALNKADTTTGGFLTRLQQLVADATTETTIEKSADGDQTPATTPPAAAESVPTTAEGDEAVAKRAAHLAAVKDTLAKGMWSLSSFADLLQTVAYMAQDAEWEKEWERDGSTVPADLRAWLQMGVELFKKMSEEETAELIASVMPPAAADVTVLALAASGDLAKQGARNSKADQQKIQTVHDHAVSLGAACDAEKAAESGDLQKRADAAIEQVTTLEKSVSDLTAAREALTKRVKDLEAMPVDGKGVVRHVTVAKTDDASALAKTEVPTADPTNPLGVMKAVHATGGHRVLI